MSETRTDPHRPGAIIPSDYAYVLSYGAYKPEGAAVPVRFNVDKALAIARSGNFFGKSLFKCSVCGAHFNHGDVWIHTSGQYITLGMDCAEKYSMFAGRAEWEAWHKSQTALRSAAAKDKRFKMAALKFMALHPGLQEALAYGATPRVVGEDRKISYAKDTLADILGRVNKWGSVSDKTVAYALKLGADLAKPQEAKVEEATVPAPEGRVTVLGTIVCVKSTEGFRGGIAWKMIVKVTTPTGSWKVWSTVPSSISDAYFAAIDAGTATSGDLRAWLTGKTVEFVASLKRSDRDAHFAFGKRPTGARLVA